MTHAADHPPQSTPPLVVRCGAFGDMVMLTPLLRLLAARYGRPVDLVSSGAWTAPLLRHDPALGELHLLTSRKTPYALCPSQWALVRWLRSRPAGPVYLCDTDAEIHALLRRGGVESHDIVARPGGEAVRTWPQRWLEMGMRDPARARPTRPVDAAGFAIPALVVTDADREDLARWRAARALDGPLILFQPGNKRTHKRGRLATREHPKYWPPAHWGAVADAVCAGTTDGRVLLCGSAPEHGMLEEIRLTCRDPLRVHNLAGDLPIPRLLALLEVAHSMVSVDTGPAHAAAALGCPLVVLFGGVPPALWRPTGPGPIVLLGGERGVDSRVAEIDVATVVSAWRSLPPR